MWREEILSPLVTLRDLFFPLHCAVCTTPLKAGDLCASCLGDVKKVPEPFCMACSHPLVIGADRAVCVNCEGRGFHFNSAVAVYQSHGVLRDLVHRLKYAGEAWLAHPLGKFLQEGFSDPRLREIECIDAIVPVPLHPLRQRERGYNQAELLGRELARQTGLPLVFALKRTRNTVTQTHFDREKRMQNLRNAFVLRQNAPVQDKHLLLLDDVLTTGSTLDDCARVLLAAGAKNVHALTLARG